MNKFLVVALVTVVGLLASCGTENATISSSPTTNSMNTASKASGAGSGFGPGGGGGGGREEQAQQTISLNQAQSSQSSPISADRKIVRNAELSLESEKPDEAQSRIAAIAQSKGGFVVESQQSSSDPRVNTRDLVQLSVRVPTDRFTEALDEIKAASGRLIAETIKGEDVTEEFIDIDARLRAKKALEQQFTEIMKRANSVEDALSVQSELAEVRGEIEKIEGRRRFLENQSSLSTIKIRLQTPAVFAARSAGFLDRLAESFGTGFDVAINFVLGLVTFLVGALPLVLFIGLPGFLITRAVMRRRSRSMSVTEIARDEIKDD